VIPVSAISTPAISDSGAAARSGVVTERGVDVGGVDVDGVDVGGVDVGGVDVALGLGWAVTGVGDAAAAFAPSFAPSFAPLFVPSFAPAS
jgi:hypothetical protein